MLDVVGPLGNPTPIENHGTVICIGGGVGTAELLPIAKALKAAGQHGERRSSARGRRTW